MTETSVIKELNWSRNGEVQLKKGTLTIPFFSVVFPFNSALNSASRDLTLFSTNVGVIPKKAVKL